MNVNKKGFTLIELLVVVAIIGVLAGIVLVSLNSARTKADKSSLQSTLASVIPVASMCVNEGGTIQEPITPGTTKICSLTDEMEEVWPKLPDALSGKGYGYSLASQDSIIGTKTEGDITTTIITCTVSTGSCQ